jgi:uncharacterized protein (TIGR02217 family)
MAFYESPRFPETIGQGAEGGPEYLVDVIELRSGREQRTLIQDLPRQRYTVSFVNREQSEFETLLAFFRNAKGRAHGFRFKDKFDYQATSSTGIFTLIAGSPSNYYQMYKRYTSGIQTEDRKITKPVSGTITVYDNGSPMGSGYSLDYTTGIALITGGGGPFTWAGQFDVPVRFGGDIMKPSFLNIGNGERLWSWDGIELIELRQ